MRSLAAFSLIVALIAPAAGPAVATVLLPRPSGTAAAAPADAPAGTAAAPLAALQAPNATEPSDQNATAASTDPAAPAAVATAASSVRDDAAAGFGPDLPAGVQPAPAPAAAAAAGGADAASAPRAFLARAMPGAAAARALAPERVAEVAASVGWTPAKLQHTLKADAALHYVPPAPSAGSPGLLVYSCSFGYTPADSAWLAPPAADSGLAAAAPTGGVAATNLMPPGQGDLAPTEAFKPHRMVRAALLLPLGWRSHAVLQQQDTLSQHPPSLSRPGASRIIYLDFDGHVTSGTSWQGSDKGAAIVTPPFSVDGDSTTFSDQERRIIAAIWRSVAEDFASWDIDVTTGGCRGFFYLPRPESARRGRPGVVQAPSLSAPQRGRTAACVLTWLARTACAALIRGAQHLTL